MTQEPQEDMVFVPEEETPEGDLTEGKRRKGLSPAMKLGGVIVGGGLLLTTAIMMMQAEDIGDSQLRRPPTLDATPGGQVLSESPDFQQLLRERNEQRSQLAEERGITSMPTPEIDLQPRAPQIRQAESIPEIAPRTPEPAPQVARVDRRVLPAPTPTSNRQVAEPQPQPQAQPAVTQAAPQQPQAEEEENPYVDAMASYMSNISRRQQPIGFDEASLPTPKWLTDQREAAANAAEAADTAGNGAVATTTVLRPGDILYGEMVNSVNSDMDAPVLAEITTGPQRGARLVGSFTADQRAERMVVNFTSMTLPDGTSVGINAFAVDGRSAETAVASDVDRRLISRYAPVLASTFISAYAQSRSQPRRRIIGTGQDLDVEVDQSTGRQAVFAGAGAAADVLSRDIAASAPRGPLISLKSGFAIAILFVDGVDIPDND